MATTKKTTKGLRASIRNRKTKKTAAKSTRRLVAMTAPPPSSSSSASSSRAESTNNSAAVDSASGHDSATNDDNVADNNHNNTNDFEQNANETSRNNINKWKSNTGSSKRWRLAQRRLAEQAAQQEAERQTPEEAACAASVRLARQNRSSENHLREMVDFWKTQPGVKVVDLKRHPSQRNVLAKMDKKSVKDVPASTAARPVEKAAPANNRPKVDNSRRALEIFCDQMLLKTREVQDAQEKTGS